VIAIAIIGIVFSSGMVIFSAVLTNKFGNEATMKVSYLAHQEFERVMQLRYSDIDDENSGGSKIDFPAPNDSYSYEVIVDNVLGSSLNGAAQPDDTTHYKRVYVDVEHSLVGTLRLTGLVTNSE